MAPRRSTHLQRTTTVLLALALAGALGGTPASAELVGTTSALGTTTSTEPLVESALGVVSTATNTTEGLLAGADWGYAEGHITLSEVRTAMQANALVASGYDGRGVGVALIDTGVAPVAGLSATRLSNGPDISLDSPAANLRHVDEFGHGTHMAGIIAGNDGQPGGFRGVAPGASLTSIKVGASSGAVDVSQVIAGIDWAVEHRNAGAVPIRVIALAYGTDSVQSYELDPLAHAVENAWRAGMVVVVSGGNRGAGQPRLDSPATDPYVIAVGADDSRDALTSLDDSVPQFSSRGSASRHVDVVAPGQSIASLRVQGSYVDVQYPIAALDEHLFKGSGTSQAAAAVAGGVANLLSQRPSLTPDQVKSILRQSATPLVGADTQSQGAGLVNLSAAAATPAALTVQSFPRSTGTGSLEGSRGSQHVGDAGTDLAGERDIRNFKWDAPTWAAASSNQTSWSGGSWNGRSWTGTGWTGSSWGVPTWEHSAWKGGNWAGVEWSSRSWSSRSWSSRSWSSRSWSGDAWTSRSWSSRSWSSRSWSGNGW